MLYVCSFLLGKIWETKDNMPLFKKQYAIVSVFLSIDVLILRGKSHLGVAHFSPLSRRKPKSLSFMVVFSLSLLTSCVPVSLIWHLDYLY